LISHRSWLTPWSGALSSSMAIGPLLPCSI
jgi:hypothetical protein